MAKASSTPTRWSPAIWRGDPRKPPLAPRLRLPHVKAAGRRDAPASAAGSGNPAERNGLPSLASDASFNRRRCHLRLSNRGWRTAALLDVLLNIRNLKYQPGAGFQEDRGMLTTSNNFQ